MSAVEVCVVAEVCFENSSPEPGRMLLSWEPADPWTVWLRIDDGPTWELSLQLLLRGMKKLSGIGDLRVSADDNALILELRPPDGEAVIALPLNRVGPYLREVKQLAKPAQHAYDWDAVISDLLGGPPC